MPAIISKSYCDSLVKPFPGSILYGVNMQDLLSKFIDDILVKENRALFQKLTKYMLLELTSDDEPQALREYRHSKNYILEIYKRVINTKLIRVARLDSSFITETITKCLLELSPSNKELNISILNSFFVFLVNYLK